MTERFGGILAKKKDAFVKCSNVKEEKKAKRFNILMAVIEKKINLDEKKTTYPRRFLSSFAALILFPSAAVSFMVVARFPLAAGFFTILRSYGGDGRLVETSNANASAVRSRGLRKKMVDGEIGANEPRPFMFFPFMRNRHREREQLFATFLEKLPCYINCYSPMTP